MRRIAALGFVAALGLAVTGLTQATPSQTLLTGKCVRSNLDLTTPGRLTLATDNLSFPPWWGGKGTGDFSPSDPYSGKGYEAAVSYEVARRLGFSKAEVTWTPIPFSKSYAPGKKTFDWYLSQVSYTPERARAVDFSNAYYYVNQAVLALKGAKIARVKTIAGLKPYTLGAPVGTTSYNYIVRYVKPKGVKVYDTVNDSIIALKNRQIDALVIDYPSTGYITGVQLPASTVVGRLPDRGVRERFGMVFEKGASLDSCVNRALAGMWADGTLKRFEARWLASAGGAPILK